jgi:O-antigen ligase
MWLLLLMVCVMPFETSPYLMIADSFLGIFQDFTVIKALGLVALAWALLRIASGDIDEGILSSLQAKLFIFFFAGVIVSGLLSGSGFVVVSKYLAFLFFLPFVLVSVRTHDDLRKVLYALAGTLILIFPYAYRQSLRFGDRLGIGFSETNYFAANLVLVLPLAFAIALQQRTSGRRRLWLLGSGVLLLEIFLTSSRGGFLGLLAASMVFVTRRRGFGSAFALAAAMIVAIVVLPTDIGQRALATIGGAQPPPGLEQSNQAHTALFWAGFRMIAAAPLWGVGPFNFKSLSGYYSGLDINFIAHNTFLEIAAELGIPVFVIFISLLLVAFGAFGRASRLRGSPQAEELAGWAEGLRAGLVGFLVAGTFISAEYEKYFWLVIFLSIVVDRLTRRHEMEAVMARHSTEMLVPTQ